MILNLIKETRPGIDVWAVETCRCPIFYEVFRVTNEFFPGRELSDVGIHI